MQDVALNHPPPQQQVPAPPANNPYVPNQNNGVNQNLNQNNAILNNPVNYEHQINIPQNNQQMQPVYANQPQYYYPVQNMYVQPIDNPNRKKHLSILCFGILLWLLGSLLMSLAYSTEYNSDNDGRRLSGAGRAEMILGSIFITIGFSTTIIMACVILLNYIRR